MKKISILGSGQVAKVLAEGLKALNYEVQISNRTGHGVEGWDGKVSDYSRAAQDGDLIILSVKGVAAEEVVTSVASELDGKTVIDTTNPISDIPAEDGVLNYFTSMNESLMERLQNAVPKANFVKAFNMVGSPHMVKPQFKDGTPTMFICGDSQDAKKEVTNLLKELGWHVEDFGGVKSARAIEPLCILWCIPGFQGLAGTTHLSYCTSR